MVLLEVALFGIVLGALVLALWSRSASSERDREAKEKELVEANRLNHFLEQQLARHQALLQCKDDKQEDLSKRISGLGSVAGEAERKIALLQQQLQHKEIQRIQLSQQLRRAQKAACMRLKGHGGASPGMSQLDEHGTPMRSCASTFGGDSACSEQVPFGPDLPPSTLHVELLQQEVSELQEELQDKRKALVQAEKRVSEVEQLASEHNQQVLSLQAELAAACARGDDVAQQLSVLTEVLGCKQGQLEAQAAVCEALQSQLSEASAKGKQQLQEAEDEAQQAQQQLRRALEELAEAQQQREQAAGDGAQRAREAEQRAGEAEQRAGEAEQRAGEAEQRAGEAEQRATEAEKQRQEARDEQRGLAAELEAYRVQADKLTSRAERQAQELQHAAAARDAVAGELEEAQRVAVAQQEALEAAEQSVARLTGEMATFQQEHEGVLFDRDQLLQQTGLMQTELQASRQLCSKLGDDFKMLQSTLNITQQELEHQMAATNQIDGALERHRLGIRDMHAVVNAVQGNGGAAFAFLGGEMQTMERLVAELSKRALSSATESSDFKAKVLRLQQANDHLSAERNGLQKVRDAYKQRASLLEAEVADAAHLLQGLQSDHDELLARHQELEAKLTAAQAELSAARLECAVLEAGQEEKKALEVQVAALNQHIEELGREAEDAAVQGRVLESMQDLNASLSLQVEQLQQQLQQAEGQAQAAQGDVCELQAEVAALASGRAAVEEEGEVLKKEIQGLEGELAQLQLLHGEDKAGWAKDRAQLGVALEELHCCRRELAATEEAMREALQQREAEGMAEAVAALADCRKQLAETEAARAAAQEVANEMRDCCAQLDQVREQLAVAMQRDRELEAEQRRLAAALQQAQAQLAEAATASQAAQERAVGEVREELAGVRAEAENAAAEVEGMRGEVEGLRRAEAAAQSELEGLREQNAALAAEVEGLGTAAEAAQAVGEGLRWALQEAQAEVEGLGRSRAEAQAEVQALSGELHILRAHNASLSSEVDELRADLDAHAMESDALNEQVERYSHALAEVHRWLHVSDAALQGAGGMAGSPAPAAAAALAPVARDPAQRDLGAALSISMQPLQPIKEAIARATAGKSAVTAAALAVTEVSAAPRALPSPLPLLIVDERTSESEGGEGFTPLGSRRSGMYSARGSRVWPSPRLLRDEQVVQQLDVIQRLGAGIPQLRKDALASRAEAEALRARLAEAEQCKGALQTELESVQQQVGELRSELEGVKGGADAVCSELAAAVREVAGLRGEVEALREGKGRDAKELEEARHAREEAEVALASEQRATAGLRADLQALVAELEASGEAQAAPARSAAVSTAGSDPVALAQPRQSGSSRNSRDSVTFWIGPPLAPDQEPAPSAEPSNGSSVGGPAACTAEAECVGGWVAALRAGMVAAESRLKAARSCLAEAEARALESEQLAAGEAIAAAEATAKLAEAEARQAALQLQLDAAAAECAILAARVVEMEETKGRVRGEVEALQAEVEGALQRVEREASQRVTGLQGLLDECEGRLQEATERCEGLLREVQDLQREREGAEEAVAEAEGRAVAAQGARAEAEGKAAAAEQARVGAEGRATAAEEAKVQAEGRATAAEAGRNAAECLVAAAAEARAQAERRAAAAEQARQEGELLVAALEEACQDLEQKGREAEQLQAELGVACARLAEAQGQVSSLTADLTAARGQAAAATQELGEARAECGRGREELGALQRASEAAAAVFRKLQGENEELSGNYRQLTSSYEDTCGEAHRLGLQNHSLVQEVNEQQDQLVDADLRLRSQGERLQELGRQLEEATAERDRCVWEAGQLRQELKQVTDTLNAEMAELVQGQQASVVAACRERDEAERRCGEQEALVLRLSAQVEHQRTQVSDYIERVGSATIEQISLKLQISSLETKVRSLQEQLDKVGAHGGAADGARGDKTRGSGGGSMGVGDANSSSPRDQRKVSGHHTHAAALIRTASEISAQMHHVHSEFSRLRTPRTTASPRMSADSVGAAASEAADATQEAEQLEQRFEDLKEMYDSLFMQFKDVESQLRDALY